MRRTRIKICGLTRETDIAEVVSAGADAIGLVFYPKSARYVTPESAAQLASCIPPFIQLVGLFVNPTVETVASVKKQVPLSLLQFHGEETPALCAEIARTVGCDFIRAARVGQSTTAADLCQFEQQYRQASPYFKGLLLDTLVDQYGGSGKVFDWSVIPKELAHQVVLSGGLNARNVIDAIQQIAPYAVDISSGVELSKGIKDANKIRQFVHAVHQSDALRNKDTQ